MLSQVSFLRPIMPLEKMPKLSGYLCLTCQQFCKTFYCPNRKWSWLIPRQCDSADHECLPQAVSLADFKDTSPFLSHSLPKSTALIEIMLLLINEGIPLSLVMSQSPFSSFLCKEG